LPASPRSVLLTLSISIHEELNELCAGAEVCLRELPDGIRKIRKTMLRCEIKNAQRALNGDVPSSRLVSRRSVVGQENIGREFLGKCDGLPFTEVENGWENRQRQTRLFNRDPLRKIFHPQTDRIWATFLCQFTNHAWGKHDCAIKDGEEMDLLDKHDVAKGACIGQRSSPLLVTRRRDFFLAFLPEPFPDCHFLLQLVNREVQPDAAPLQKTVEVIPSHSQQSGKLVFRESMRSIGFDCHVFQGNPCGIMTCRDHLSGYFVRQFDDDLHGKRITLAISRDFMGQETMPPPWDRKQSTTV
jgi:hypothetical protein